MADRTSIEWTDSTWNPVIGCSKVSPGCDNCYAIGQAARIIRMTEARDATTPYQGTVLDDGSDWTGTVKCLPERLDQPLRWKRPRRIFVNSMSDLFHPDVPAEFVAEVFAVMSQAPQHQFQVLTKRPQRAATLFNDVRFNGLVVDTMLHRFGDRSGPLPVLAIWSHDGPLPNVWAGTSIESDRYTFRADHLRDTPAAVRWISAEPLLGPLPSLDLTGIDWLVVGGESGANHRPINPDWVRDLRDRAVDAGVAFLFKQWGGRTAKAGGRELDGRTWDEYPDQS